MKQPLLTIGASARAVGLAPSALRYYDECGLLRPAEVDDATGYRYYTPELERRAQAVAQMRDAGLSVEVMRTALDGTVEDRRRGAARGAGRAGGSRRASDRPAGGPARGAVRGPPRLGRSP